MTDVRPCAMVDRETLIPCAFTICKDQARQVLCTMLANPPPIPIIGRPEFNVYKDANPFVTLWSTCTIAACVRVTKKTKNEYAWVCDFRMAVSVWGVVRLLICQVGATLLSPIRVVLERLHRFSFWSPRYLNVTTSTKIAIATKMTCLASSEIFGWWPGINV